MAIDLLTLKKEVLYRVKDFLKKSSARDIQDAEFETLTLDLKDLKLFDIMGYFKQFPQAYYRNKENSSEILGIGSDCVLRNRWDIQKKVKLIHLNHLEVSLMGGISFHSHPSDANEWKKFGNCFYFIPRLQFETENNQTFLKVHIPLHIIESQVKQMSFLLNIEKDLTFTHYREGRNVLISQDHHPSQEEWLKLNEHALKNINKSELKKIVLSRKRILKYKNKLSPFAIIEQLEKINPHSFLYLLAPSQNHAFVSCSPERLFSYENEKVHVDIIAGTTHLSGNTLEDTKMGEALLKDSKELAEHRFVGQQVEQGLEKTCESVQWEFQEKVLKLKHIQHIWGKISSTLKKDKTPWDVLCGLHPTPAVGGHPQRMAMDLLPKWENFERGFFASPLGFFSNKKSDFLVGIRSALIEHNSLHIFAGAGIVAQSEPLKEWHEIHNKMKNYEGLRP
jgi:menaquinone-specific isochorismate synthase